MPRLENERLTPQQTADVLAYMLQFAKYPAGRTELVMNDAALKQVTFPTAAARSKTASAQMPTLSPGGNMAQLCGACCSPHRILFSLSRRSILASRDPTQKMTPTGGIDFFAWGQGIYKGWDVIDYAAVSLADSAQLMLTPGRTCENGRPVPVTDPDWIRFTNELAEAGKATYKASQTRNQETVSNITEQLNNSCANCHRVFRGRTRCVKSDLKSELSVSGEASHHLGPAWLMA